MGNWLLKFSMLERSIEISKKKSPLHLVILLSVFRQRIHFQIAGAAKDRATLRRVKGDGRVAAAFGAVNGDFDFLFNARFTGGDNRVEPFILRLLAFLTAFWRILQPFVAEKYLLAD